jgi:hypothetical protein
MDLEDYQLGTIFSGMTKEMRPYMDMRWRHHAKMVSHSGLGIIFPAHDQPELEGYFNILGARKYFSVTNYKSVRNLMINRKFPDEKKTAIWHDSHADYRCGGFIFDLENLINNDSSFITQMKEAYIYFDITGFDPKMLVNYKKQYLHSCINFRLT